MFRFRQSVALGVLVASLPALAAGAPVLAGPIWDGDFESDAKQDPESAQVVTTEGSVLQIKGRLTGTAFQGGADYIDMYLVRITAPTILAISTAGGDFGGGAQFDSQLFLFRASQNTQGQLFAQGILASDDASASNPGAFLNNSANDGSQFTLTQTGLYFIAVTTKGVQARNPNGALLWPELGVPGLRSFAGFDLFESWTGDPSGGVGQYEIRLTGVEGVPAPGALALLGLAGLTGRRRR